MNDDEFARIDDKLTDEIAELCLKQLKHWVGAIEDDYLIINLSWDYSDETFSTITVEIRRND